MLDFNVVREVLLEFLAGERGIAITDIQPCHLGFARHIDRDNFVLNEPYPYQDVHFTFTKHNEGRGDVPTSTLAPGLLELGVSAECYWILWKIALVGGQQEKADQSSRQSKSC